MAHRSHGRGADLIDTYRNLNTIPAIAGIAFAVSAAVQFLGATFAIEPTPEWAYTFQAQHALIVSLAALLVAFASSETKDWQFYDSWEQGIVVLALVTILGMEYVTEVSEVIVNNQPVTGFAAFAVGMAAWGVLAR